MAALVSRQKYYFSSIEFSCQKAVGGRTKRGLQIQPLLSGEPFYIVKAATANDTDSMHRSRRIEEPFPGEEKPHLRCEENAANYTYSCVRNALRRDSTMGQKPYIR